MKWFGWKSARVSPRPALAQAGSMGFGEWPRSYEAQVREGYCLNPIAQRAVKLVSEGAGGAPLAVSDPAVLALVTARSEGQPKTTSYSYTASFAVALSARAVVRVGRIWAEGKLLRGAAGDFKTGTGFRLHLGGEDQAVDPLIAAAEGLDMAPAHRGIAYAVFEDMELGDYGNRIPSLTFEVFADEGGCAIGEIVTALAPAIAAEAGAELDGFSAYGASTRAAVETLAGAAGAWFRAEGDGLTLTAGDGVALYIEDAGVGAERGTRAIAAADTAPRALSLSYYDPARDYQAGVQRATRPGAGWQEARVELPAAIDAGGAKAIAEASLARMDLERERRTVALGWEALAIPPGARVRIAGTPGVWRVDRWRIEAMVVTLECVPVAPAPLPALASAGRVLAAPDALLGTTVLHVFELPPLDDSAATQPRVAIAAAGTGSGWRGAALLLSSDTGVHWTSGGGTAPPAILGVVAVAPGAASARIEDRVHRVEVVLAHGGMVLGDADAAAIDAGANLAMLGDELIQFASAEPLGGARWRLRGLWRGRRGTEGAIGTQAVGDRFVLLTSDTIAIADTAVAIGGSIAVLAEGPGDAGTPAEAMATVGGVSVLPPAPVHLHAEPQADGRTRLAWTRRSRVGWRWVDGVDAPLGEEREAYRVTLQPEGGAGRTLECSGAEWMLDATDRAEALTITVRQIGNNGLSGPAMLVLPPLGGS
jgi:hypothetical protein